uniref:Replication factor Mcm10 C-terminal domain-containing protein n=1 Tax=Eptatretus burgeri TaxID=7764 RepID=A0A8C4R777_EPTBU
MVAQADEELQQQYFHSLEKKEQLEEKMRDTMEVPCRVVSCAQCKYTHYRALDSCSEQAHKLTWHSAKKRFFRCHHCGERAVSFDRLPKRHCRKCGVFKWERDGMLKEKKGPKIGGETLQPRGRGTTSVSE